jgi:SAM-dependent methyltransferase
MKRKIETGALAFLVVAMAGFLLVSKPGPAPGGGPLPGPPAIQKAPESAAEKETTLRNVTNRTITYKVYPVSRPEALETRTIAPNAIDRFRTKETLAVEFNTGAKDVIYSLDPGAPYSFRYDQGTEVDLFLGSHGRADAVDLAPYVPTPSAVVDKMLEMAGVNAKDVLYDIGCGDGRIVIAAARKFGAAGVGIDIDQAMVDRSIANAQAAGVAARVRFICTDATKADVSPATVVTLYLLPESNALLRPFLEKQLRPGARVVSHNYVIAGWENRKTGEATLEDESGKDHTIYLYVR